MALFKFVQKDKEDERLAPQALETYAKLAKASYHASLRASKLGVGAKGIEKFLLDWKYRTR